MTGENESRAPRELSMTSKRGRLDSGRTSRQVRDIQPRIPRRKRKEKRERKRNNDRRSLSGRRKKEYNRCIWHALLFALVGDTYHRIYKTWLLSQDELLFPSHHWHRLCPRRIFAGVIGWVAVPLRRGRRPGFVHFHSCVLFVFSPEILLSPGGAL